ncbi:hypothetical protein QBC38DRAFT_544098 [Podospora fimiseda]|uniref:Killer toxin Kp4 domain-containing protein n=1 Tax=Podospora fimiseda TaxID=252190 RepID=A0AAN7GWW3_9PEZI|nr:hypothetical protein QBC38DRAFT_544098 [Podospora fimiseda]
MHFTTAILLTFSTLTTAQSCSGSFRCPKTGDIALRLSGANTDPNVVSVTASTAIETIDLQRLYRDGQQIACHRVSGGGVCAFLERTGDGLTGDKIKELAGFIPRSGCKACGSVPISLASGQDGREGILKFDFTTRTCLDGDRGDVQICA